MTNNSMQGQSQQNVSHQDQDSHPGGDGGGGGYNDQSAYYEQDPQYEQYDDGCQNEAYDSYPDDSQYDDRPDPQYDDRPQNEEYVDYSDRSQDHQQYDRRGTVDTHPRRGSTRQPYPSGEETDGGVIDNSWLFNDSAQVEDNEVDDEVGEDIAAFMARRNKGVPVASGGDDDDRTMGTMATKGLAFRSATIKKAKDMTAPTGEVTIIYTDVQGSTALWEACPSDMKKAQDIHDQIMRKCYTDHSGYEIITEGDAFNLAFQHPVDALAFALKAQLKLYKADWPAGILKQSDGKDKPKLKFRGYRVRFGVHHGPTTNRIHESTGRPVYSGEAVKVSKCVEGLCHGGQILTTMETWKAISGMAERCLGRPQVLDCGEHVLYETKDPETGRTIRHSRRIMQLVPSELAFDYFEARGLKDVENEDGTVEYVTKDARSITGRLFPPLVTKRQLTTCFLNAFYANNEVAICFVYTKGLEENGPEEKSRNLKRLAKFVRSQLLRMNPPGYECQEDAGCWMLAFARAADAATFGLKLTAGVFGVKGLEGDVDRERMFKIGAVQGPFASMGPHKTTGMADYFGPIVNRAARVASVCEQGQVCVGVPLTDGATVDPPNFGKDIYVELEGVKQLKGITIDFAIFSCRTG